MKPRLSAMTCLNSSQLLTRVVLAATNENATYSNGSLAASRIVNAARSPQGVLFFTIKFPIGTAYNTLKVFRGCLEKFVAARPREWVKFCAFRSTQVVADAGFVEYLVAAQHRESQNFHKLRANRGSEYRPHAALATVDLL